MDRTEIFTKVEGIFRDLLDDESFTLSESDSAATISDWESLFHITLIATIEDEFKISLSADAVAKPKNVGVLIDMIEQELNQA